jgi:hypothetical protein
VKSQQHAPSLAHNIKFRVRNQYDGDSPANSPEKNNRVVSAYYTVPHSNYFAATPFSLVELGNLHFVFTAGVSSSTGNFSSQFPPTATHPSLSGQPERIVQYRIQAQRRENPLFSSLVFHLSEMKINRFCGKRARCE